MRTVRVRTRPGSLPYHHITINDHYSRTKAAQLLTHYPNAPVSPHKPPRSKSLPRAFNPTYYKNYSNEVQCSDKALAIGGFVYISVEARSVVITYILLGITVLVSFYAWNNPTAMASFIMNPYRVHKRKEYYRLITSGFIHHDHLHLLLNAISLYYFGLGVERVFRQTFGQTGNFYYVLLYVLALIISDLPTLFKNKDKPYYNSLGASGAVSAIVFAYIVFRPLAEICLFFAICLPGFIMGVLFVIFSYYQGKRSMDNINHDAHLYGGLFGILFCIVLHPSAIGEFFEQVSQWRFL